MEVVNLKEEFQSCLFYSGSLTFSMEKNGYVGCFPLVRRTLYVPWTLGSIIVLISILSIINEDKQQNIKVGFRK